MVKIVEQKLGEEYIVKLMEYAAQYITKELNKRGKSEYVDDMWWGDNSFKINIFANTNNHSYKHVNDFTFIYDDDDVFERSAEAQLDDELEEFFDIMNNY